MPYCSRCGVELSPGALSCVLCATPVQFPPSEPTKDDPPYPVVTLPNTLKEKTAWFVLTTLFSIAVGALLAINIIGNGEATWSLYPIVGISAAWLYTTISVFLIRRRWIAMSGWIVVTLAFLAVLNALNHGHDWFWPLAFPITMIAGAALMIIVAAVTHSRSISFILACILAMIALACVGIDITIHHYVGPLRVSWSLFVLSAVVPLEALLLTYYVFFRKRVDLRRYFHV